MYRGFGVLPLHGEMRFGTRSLLEYRNVRMLCFKKLARFFFANVTVDIEYPSHGILRRYSLPPAGVLISLSKIRIHSHNTLAGNKGKMLLFSKMKKLEAIIYKCNNNYSTVTTVSKFLKQ